MKIKLEPWAQMPSRGHAADAGLDLRAPYAVTVPARGSVEIDTGVHIEIPHGLVGFLKSKSGLNVKFNIVGEGVIDAEYTGTIVAKLYNHGDHPVDFKEGDKIIQIVFLPVYIPHKFQIVDEFEPTERGDGGFGSTGR